MTSDDEIHYAEPILYTNISHEVHEVHECANV